MLERVETLRREGKLRPSFDMDLDSDGDPPVSLNAGAVEKQSTDVWASVVEAAVARGKSRRAHNYSHRAGGARSVPTAALIRGYWEGFAAKKERAKMQEEKRLRGLAKATIKMVIAQWKKAVFVSLICLIFFLLGHGMTGYCFWFWSFDSIYVSRNE